MKRFKELASVLVLIGVFIAVGCKTPQIKEPCPEWTMKGSGAFGGERGKSFYGVASASGIKDPSLKRETADNRARNEVAKVFQFYTKSLMKDYTASIRGGDMDVTSEEQLVERAMKTVTSMTLSGVEIVDHCKDKETGELFALARLDINAFKDNLGKAKELSERAKQYIRNNAERVHEEMEKEVEKLEKKESSGQ